MREQMVSPVVSLLSGAMGLDLGLEQAGIETTLAVEIDPYCCSTIRQNWPAIDMWETDIQKLDGQAIRARLRHPKDIWLMIGGPPARAFVQAERERPSLIPEGT